MRVRISSSVRLAEAIGRFLAEFAEAVQRLAPLGPVRLPEDAFRFLVLAIALEDRADLGHPRQPGSSSSCAKRG